VEQTVHLVSLVLFSVVGVAIATASNLDIVFVLDVSPTMIEPERAVAAGARLASFELSAADRIGLMTFLSRTSTILPPGSPSGDLAIAFQRATQSVVERRGLPKLLDTLVEAISGFAVAADDRRRVIAAITNQTDRASKHTAQEVIQQARLKNIEIYLVLMAKPSGPKIDSPYPPVPRVTVPYPDVDGAAVQLRPIAEKTGGKLSLRDPNGYVLRKVLSELKGTDQ
jgi:uncharacterized protein (DUF58 family)